MFSRSLVLAVIFAIVNNCGSVEFSGASVGTIDNETPPLPPSSENQTPGTPVEPPVVPPVPPAPFSLINWYWQCASQPDVPTAGQSEKVMTGADQLSEADFERLIGSKFVFSGRLCPPSLAKRDVVFVIDVSGSMDNLSTVGASGNRTGNDLFINGSCGRYDAIKSIADAAQGEDIRFGLVTFADTIKNNSTSFYSNLAEIEAKFNKPLVNVVCDGNGGTNFTQALRGAEDLFANHGRPDALVKEVYLISDGAPSPTSANGITEATLLKTNGVRIATALLQGNSDTNPAHLEQQIASKDDLGVPYHATVQNAQDLAASLAALAVNKITSASMKYRPIGADEAAWSDVDLMAHLTGFNFKFEAFKITEELAPFGLEALFTYSDKYGNIVESKGELKWNLSGLTR